MECFSGEFPWVRFSLKFLCALAEMTSFSAADFSICFLAYFAVDILESSYSIAASALDIVFVLFSITNSMNRSDQLIISTPYSINRISSAKYTYQKYSRHRKDVYKIYWLNTQMEQMNIINTHLLTWFWHSEKSEIYWSPDAICSNSNYLYSWIHACI